MALVLVLLSEEALILGGHFHAQRQGATATLVAGSIAAHSAALSNCLLTSMRTVPAFAHSNPCSHPRIVL